MKLTNIEKETVINFNEAERTASVYTHNEALKRQLLELCRTHPEQVRQTAANAWGGQLSDIFFPTSGFFIATLVISKCDYTKWIRFYTPLMIILGVMASAALYIQQVFNIQF